MIRHSASRCVALDDLPLGILLSPFSSLLGVSSWCFESVPICIRYTNQRSVYQSAYPGTALPKRPSEAKRTKQRTLVQYQSAFGLPISIPWYSPAKMTLRGETYQSKYPGTKTLIFTHYLCFFLVVRSRNGAFSVCLYIHIFPERGILNSVDHGFSLAHLGIDLPCSCCGSKVRQDSAGAAQN